MHCRAGKNPPQQLEAHCGPCPRPGAGAEGTFVRSGKRGPLPEGDLQGKAPHEIATSILTLDEDEHADEDDADAILTREVQEQEGDEADQAIPEDEQPTRPQLTRAQRLLALRLAHGTRRRVCKIEGSRISCTICIALLFPWRPVLCPRVVFDLTLGTVFPLSPRCFEADVEVKHSEKRNSDIALYKVNLEFESQRLQLQQANQWADQAQRDKMSLHGELEMRSRLFREHQANDCQEIEELMRTCCEEADRARQARIDELSVHHERNPMTVSQLLTQIHDLHNKINSLSDAREFYDPDAASSSGATHVPSQPSTFPSPRTTPCRDSGLPHDTRNIVGTSRNVFERPPAQDGRPSAFFNNSKNLATSSQELRPDTERHTKRPESEMI